MNSYKSSSGKRFKQSLVERKIRVAKRLKLEQQVFEDGYNFCEKCGNNGSNTRLDCSHQISVKKAKETGKVDLSWQISNIKILCRSCHQKLDKLDLKFKADEL